MRGSRARLAGLVAYARTRSPYYRELYRHLPDHVDDPALLPPSTKARLMERFDDWVTDPAVTLAKVREFLADPATIHRRFAGKYRVHTSSGTTGTRGVYLLDRRDRAVTAALGLRFFLSLPTAGELAKVAAAGARTAVIVAVGGHFGSSVLVPEDGRARRNYRVFPATTPLPELVERLNRFRPAVVTGYASVIALLAGEQQAGRLRIDPVLVLPGSEGLPLSAYDSIAETFGATVRNGYAATELMQPIGGCSRHWLHVNTDWALIEPVDEDYRPTPPGRPSHTVLITNLANRIQPFIRYDLGDSVVRWPDPCPCGNPRPTIRVQGRAADALNLADASGAVVRLSPLALGATVDRTPGVELYQIEQTAPTTLRVRLRAEARPDHVWRAVHDAITGLLREHRLGHVTVERATEPPVQSAGGKYRRIIPLPG
ncbi:phenylacetate--CoA ligase family protein [Amycolatopsis lurida]